MRLLAVSLLWLALAGAPALGAEAIPPSGVLGVEDAQLTPEFWIARQDAPDRPLLGRAQIDAQNARLFALDPSMHDLRKLPATLDRAQVAGWIGKLSQLPKKPLFDVDGKSVPKATLDGFVDALALDAVPASVPLRWGLIVERAPLRSFPTGLRVFTRAGDTDIDRFQETAEFPGTPVAIVHASRDGQWLFVASPRYAAWVEKRYVAEGSAGEVLGYAERAPYRVVTGASVRTVYTRERPELSQLQLDMGVRVPLHQGWPQDQPVNGQTPYTSWVIDLPIRKGDGSLQIVPALLQKNADTAADYLPLTPANLIRQAFKFLGERYGWGHAYDGRDCSGFVSDVYRSFGLQMPRNTSAQAVSPALAHRPFGDGDGQAAREQAARAARLGDLVYIPGHVMMVLGQRDGNPYVIHDVLGMSYRAGGAEHRVVLNAVSVTPLLPMLFDERQTFVDRMTSLVRMY